MKSHTQVVIIGGGVVGCSVLYHLTKLGWKDVVLVERSELTSGSTWHAAGGFHTLNSDPNVARLQAYTIDLYEEVDKLSDHSCGVHLTGGVMLAGTKERMDYLKDTHAKGRYMGMKTELISAEEAAELFPLMDPKQFVGALYDPDKGHLDPSGTTHALAAAAKVNGAEISLRNPVTELKQRPDGGWDVTTEQGVIHAEHVVNAGGLWAREVGRMVGIELPVLAMEHMYLLTDDMPEVKAYNDSTGKEVCSVIDFEGEIYMRQERGGMLLGTYEKGGVPWSPENTPWDFGHELLAPDLDRITDSLSVGFSHCPAFENAGIKQIINGPFTFAPDGNPLIGPVRGLSNYWAACGVMAGFSQGGGVGLALANWIVDGNPGFDVWGMDVSRFGDWATPGYTNAKVRENYSRRFSITFPNEELPAARPLLTTPIYDRLKSAGAVFGASYGLEQASWFAPAGVDPIEDVTFKRSNAFEHIAAECRAVRESVGLIEISSFAKYKVTGPESRNWLNHLMANEVPAQNRMTLTPMLNQEGGLIGDFTLATLAENEFYIFGSGVAEQYHMHWFEQNLPGDGSVTITSRKMDLLGISIAGPKSRDVLAKLTSRDVSNNGFRFMDFHNMTLGMIPALVGRVSFSGDLGYEIWVTPEYLNALFDLLMEAGKEFSIKLFGNRALRSLSLEKGFGTWATEYRPIYTPFEACMDRFVALQKPQFIGRDAALNAQEKGPEKRLVLLDIDADDTDAVNGEPISYQDQVVGWVTSGGYAHSINKSLALGYVPTKISVDTDSGKFKVEILGEHCPATILPTPPFDPDATRMRG